MRPTRCRASTWSTAPRRSSCRRRATRLALPSANFSYWVVPNQLQFRAAGGETMSRPNLNQLAPNSTNQAINGTPELDYTGTAGLKPIKAWSVDLSLEWYYQPHSALNAALFGKKVSERHLHRHADQRRSRHAGIRQWAAGFAEQSGEAVPLDHHRSGQWREIHLYRCRAQLAALPRERLRHAHAVHPHLEQGLRSVRQLPPARSTKRRPPRSRSASSTTRGRSTRT